MTKSKQSNNRHAAIVCVHVAKQGYPIMRAERDKPTMTEDSGWQFLCNSGELENESEAQVWSVSEVVQREPSLADFVGASVGTKLIRNSQDAPWRILNDEERKSS
jgi:hypothetical protein